MDPEDFLENHVTNESYEIIGTHIRDRLLGEKLRNNKQFFLVDNLSLHIDSKWGFHERITFKP